MGKKKIKKVLVANRGEIAIRIFRACADLGLHTVAMYSKEDVYSSFRSKADEAYQIGEQLGPVGAYLNIDLIIDLAKKRGVDAIHPGYGFLSENSTFAKLCRDNDIVFIGPTPEVIDRMGNKSQARRTMMDAGVPVVPGTKKGVHDVDVALEQARTIGWPIMIKASSGGGGKGMRVSESEEDFADMFNIAQRESVNAFGDNTMYLERAVQNPRHVEVQIIADNHGNVVALGERDCSVQRNHQKMIEESPSPLLDADEALRRRMMDDAVKAARADIIRHGLGHQPLKRLVLPYIFSDLRRGDIHLSRVQKVDLRAPARPEPGQTDDVLPRFPLAHHHQKFAALDDRFHPPPCSQRAQRVRADEIGQRAIRHFALQRGQRIDGVDHAAAVDLLAADRHPRLMRHGQLNHAQTVEFIAVRAAFRSLRRHPMAVRAVVHFPSAPFARSSACMIA